MLWRLEGERCGEQYIWVGAICLRDAGDRRGLVRVIGGAALPGSRSVDRSVTERSEVRLTSRLPRCDGWCFDVSTRRQADQQKSLSSVGRVAQRGRGGTLDEAMSCGMGCTWARAWLECTQQEERRIDEGCQIWPRSTVPSGRRAGGGRASLFIHAAGSGRIRCAGQTGP